MWNAFRFLVTGIVVWLAFSPVAQAADIKAFGARSVQYAMPGIAEDFHRDTGRRVEFVFDTSPGIVKRLSAGEAADVGLLVPRFFDQAVKSAHVIGGSRTVFGKIGVGIAVRDGASTPRREGQVEALPND